ncbi:TM2 domain-containing protein [Sinomicrobium weinanense]|uniref:TM2 domain-containing protein n=1 Tax=Sinomicrobium weinanense TaxID=2842200 RepID=A0A926JWQ1_9FLAO|nr:TM2 domain-containing protein [Sinomicrobium weinanense]MBC9798582.1 TM2 domain-containing protein [Sinomicrobium weinanense]MBU3125593.1 TM2 domain-containing protein [Sinomicrobium weinanense]
MHPENKETEGFPEITKNSTEFTEEWAPENRSKRLLAGVLAILIGFLGIHKFVLGYIKEGIVQIVFTVVTFGAGGLISLIEGILYLARSDEDFYRTYQIGKRSWF